MQKKLAGHKAELVNQLLNLRVSLHSLQDEATALTQKITELTGKRNLLQELLTKTGDNRRQLEERIRAPKPRNHAIFIQLKAGESLCSAGEVPKTLLYSVLSM